MEARLRKLVLSRVVQPYSMPEALAEDAALGAAALALLARDPDGSAEVVEGGDAVLGRRAGADDGVERRDGEAQEDEEKEGDRAAREPDAKAPVGLPKMIERAGRFLGNGDKEFNAKTFLKGVARLEPPFRAYFHTDQVTNVLFSETKSDEEKAQFLAPCILQLAELYSKGAIGADVKGDTTAVANAADE